MYVDENVNKVQSVNRDITYTATRDNAVHEAQHRKQTVKWGGGCTGSVHALLCNVCCLVTLIS